MRDRRRAIVAGVVVAVLIVAAAAVGGYLLLLRTVGSPQQTAASYLSGWQRASYSAMEQVSVNVPPGGLAGPLREAGGRVGNPRIRPAPRPGAAARRPA